jgi:hypothetical protein
MQREYHLIYQWLQRPEGQGLRVVMDTPEFGRLESRILSGVADPRINQVLLDSLGDEVMDDYDARLAGRGRSLVSLARG